MDFKNLANKAKDALSKNPSIVDKAGDMIDKKTGGKFADKVDKVEDAAKKWAGADETNPDEKNPGEKNPGEQQ